MKRQATENHIHLTRVEAARSGVIAPFKRIRARTKNLRL